LNLMRRSATSYESYKAGKNLLPQKGVIVASEIVKCNKKTYPTAA